LVLEFQFYGIGWFDSQVYVRIVNSGNHRASGKVHQLCLWSGQNLDFGRLACSENATSYDSLRDAGKKHDVGNPRCRAWDQHGIDGTPLMKANPHFPYVNSGTPPCGGFVHAEVFPDETGGCEVLYRCDKCGGFQ
jgi:hypothetical protein